MSKKNPVKLISLYVPEKLYNSLYLKLQEFNEKSLNSLILKVVEDAVYKNSFSILSGIRKSDKNVRISFYSPISLYERLQTLAEEYDRPINYIVNTILFNNI
jgi:hypothetical protein